jgi:uncharacterized phage protein gp47/JayE
MSIPITIPEYLKESANDIHERILDKAPSNISVVEGDMFWNSTRPSAEEIARVKNIEMQNVIKTGFIQSTYGEYLDLLGDHYGLTRKSAIKAIHNIQFTGIIGTTISQDKIVATPATDGNESIEFKLLESKTIDETGIAIVQAKCLTDGTIGNMRNGNITVLETSINGIKEVTNIALVLEGVDTESDDDFRNRIFIKIRTPSTSGNKYDYLNWALSVDGVGKALIKPLWNGNGSVKVVITDYNGRTPTESLMTTVHDLIEEKRPIGATVTVSGIQETNINIVADLILEIGYSDVDINAAIETKLKEYFAYINLAVNTLRYHRIINIILDVSGVTDYNDITINGVRENLILGDENIPILESVVVNSVT